MAPFTHTLSSLSGPGYKTRRERQGCILGEEEKTLSLMFWSPANVVTAAAALLCLPFESIIYL